MKPIKLSVVIPSLASRNAKLLPLIDDLVRQARSDEIEIVTIIDSKQRPQGEKRNRCYAATCGEYIVNIDDDDLVSSDYIMRILEAIDQDPQVDAIVLRGFCRDADGKECTFDYRLDGVEGEWIGNTIWRSPGHLCAIRRDIALKHKFPAMRRGEDLIWSEAIKPHLLSTRRATSTQGLSGALYYYRLDNYKLDVPREPTFSPEREEQHRKIFAPQYAVASGPGSTEDYSIPYRVFLAGVCKEHSISSINDLGCGDFEIMRAFLASAWRNQAYTGFDVIPERIELNRQKQVDGNVHAINFEVSDLRRAPLNADLILCKDVLQHWSSVEIFEFLDHLNANRDKFKLALITNCNYGPTVNTEIETGGWRALDLTSYPFCVDGTKVFQWGDQIGGLKDVVMIKGNR